MASLDAAPSRIPVLVGGCGSGRTMLLRQLRERIGRTSVQHIDVERTATTPERFLRAVTSVSPFPVTDAAAAAPAGARAAFDVTLGFLGRTRTAASEPATFLLDEFLELRTFESFPGLRRVLYDCLDGLAASGNRFVLTSRYVSRTLRLLRDRSSRFEVIHMPALTAEDALDILGPIAAPPGPAVSGRDEAREADYQARTVLALADGRPMYARAIADELAMMREHGGPGSDDVISALAGLLAPEGRLAKQCSFCYELRLHRARGFARYHPVEVVENIPDCSGWGRSHRIAFSIFRKSHAHHQAGPGPPLGGWPNSSPRVGTARWAGSRTSAGRIPTPCGRRRAPPSSWG